MKAFLKLLFRPIYRMGLRDAAQIAQDYGYDIVGKPDHPEPLRAKAYSHTAQMVAATNIASLIRHRALPRPLWPVSLKWRWRERDYAKRYQQRTHICDGANGQRNAGRVVHLWALKVVFGLFLVAAIATVTTYSQDNGQDTGRLSFIYLRTDILFRNGQYMGMGSGVENRNGFAAEADVKVFGRKGFRAS
jgi:hypothetical protein